MNLLPKFQPSNGRLQQRRTDIYRELLHREAKIGGELFGPIPAGHRREFFNLDKYTWVWHEEWVDQTGERQIVTTRYDVRPNGILKSQGDQSYQLLEDEELANFYQATLTYREQVTTDYQQMLQTA